MTDQNVDITSVVREALLLAFGFISEKSQHTPTHLDMKLRLDDGTRLRAEYKSIAEGGSGIEIEIESPPAANA